MRGRLPVRGPGLVRNGRDRRRASRPRLWAWRFASGVLPIPGRPRPRGQNKGDVHPIEPGFHERGRVSKHLGLVECLFQKLAGLTVRPSSRSIKPSVLITKGWSRSLMAWARALVKSSRALGMWRSHTSDSAKSRSSVALSGEHSRRFSIAAFESHGVWRSCTGRLPATSMLTAALLAVGHVFDEPQALVDPSQAGTAPSLSERRARRPAACRPPRPRAGEPHPIYPRRPRPLADGSGRMPPGSNEPTAKMTGKNR